MSTFRDRRVAVPTSGGAVPLTALRALLLSIRPRLLLWRYRPQRRQTHFRPRGM
jgi:hypothetical protein